MTCRKQWISAIEDVKRKLEEDETMETGEGDDSLNPFSKQGETQSRAGKRKVVSDLVTAPRLIKTRLDVCLRPHRGSSHHCLLS